MWLSVGSIAGRIGVYRKMGPDAIAGLEAELRAEPRAAVSMHTCTERDSPTLTLAGPRTEAMRC